MKPFWRESQLTDQDNELITAVGHAHFWSAFRQNPSTIALQCASQGSGDLLRSLAAPLMTFGERHGPIEQTYELLSVQDNCLEAVAVSFLERGEKVPGWGSSFASEGQDPVWKPVDEVLMKYFEPLRWKMTKVTQVLIDHGRKVLPNPSAFTATAAIALQMPKRISPYLLVMGRLAAWAEIFMNETKGQ